VNVAERFGANLIQCREAAGLSQEALAYRAALHRTEIGHLERGQRLARIDTLLKLAGALNIEPGDLLAGMRWRPQQMKAGRFAFPETPS
jgi:transcriptional regulator with XRE-family HTH domain